jgi:tryptophan synthase alpha chain
MNGSERLAQVFNAGRPAFMPYAVLGYPTPAASLQIVETMVQAGADALELGVPFSDPLADGPTIQAATQCALDNGVTVSGCLDMVAHLRARGVLAPALLMGYVNPILAYGLSRFVADSVVAGVDGFIVPDLPPEEAEELCVACENHGLAMTFLAATTSTPERLALIGKKSTGFVYLVSVTGVTGMRNHLPPDLADFVARARQATERPLAVGFGIGTGLQASTVAGLADGVIVGSALVKAAGVSLASVRQQSSELADAIHSHVRFH